MATLANSLYSAKSASLRPFDPSRDMRAVADLVELCFADTLDPDGQQYLRQMRMAAESPRFLSWSISQASANNLPTSGYVWVEEGRLVGNLSLIPFLFHSRRYYLIANVAVHPDFRRKGIGRQLTNRGIEYARQKGAPAVWLQVREENLPAVDLYRNLGFSERARRTTWLSQRDPVSQSPSPSVAITASARKDWAQHCSWLERTYPPELAWHFSIDLKELRPGWVGAFQRFFSQVNLHQWAASQDGQPRGFLSRVGNFNFADSLWLAVPPESDDSVTYSLLAHARQHSSRRRALALDYPAARATQAIQDAGFYAHQTLIWMTLDFTHHP